VDRDSARARGGVGLAARVQCERVEMRIGVTGHGVLVLTVLQIPIVGYIDSVATHSAHEENSMKVSDILRIKGTTLYTTTPLAPLADAVQTMADHDLGSMLVMDHGDLVGILTFREVILALTKNGGSLGQTSVRSAMDDHPITCSPDTELDEVRRMMLERHARYLPVLSKRELMGVVSFYDVAKAVVDSQNFENQMLKAYIRDWPSEKEGTQA
jgi:CBS domain-containing protein